ncbi:MAG: DUF134 domain-containing protein [Thermodesulfovibrionales bacterium]|nr:DUF134 domain-containing protein [Thermodesulfovibrionales bacterium]
MPRHKKPRKCECPFSNMRERIFKPAGVPTTDLDRVVIFQDELEAMRLCDLQGLTQEDAGKKMNISRGTVQRLLSSARKKVVFAITDAKAIFIEPAENIRDDS